MPDVNIPEYEAVDWSETMIKKPLKRVSISIRVEPNVLAWYKLEGAEIGYQTLMNRVLRVYMEQVQKQRGFADADPSQPSTE
jgi:uncharacterized protein (DUF4415 family)